MTAPIKRKWIYLTAGLSALLLAPLGAGLAAPIAQCITDTTMCDKDLLCAFKIELEEKMILYKHFASSSSYAKDAKAAKPPTTFQGLGYDKAPYDAALAAAKKSKPGATGADLAFEAYNQFVKKSRADLDRQGAKYKQCTLLGVTPNEKLRGTWSGMVTSLPECEIGGPPTTPGGAPVPFYIFKPMHEGCQEIWESDLGHETVHQDACYARGGTRLQTLQQYIDDDMHAYRYSVESAVNNLKKMQVKCSSNPETAAFRQEAQKLIDQAKQYQAVKAAR
jgi:hypothetical protein